MLQFDSFNFDLPNEIALELSPRHEDAHYMQGCSWCQLKRYDLASDILQKSISLNPESSDRMYRLYSGVAINVKPPNYDSAADSYTQLLVRNPLDFEAVSSYDCFHSFLSSSDDDTCVNSYSYVRVVSNVCRNGPQR